jgi:HEAT repeat protein
MIGALVFLAGVLLTAAVLLLLLLVVRRSTLAVQERRYLASERRVRPLAIALVETDSEQPPELSSRDQAVLADVLARYSRQLTGEADERIAAYFRGGAAFRRAVADLRSARMWRRAAAAYRLGDMACAEAEPQLLAALDDSRREVRSAAARSLGRLGVTAAAHPLVAALVAGRVPAGVAGEALVALGADVVPELREIAADPDPRIRASAIALIGRLGDSRDAAVARRGLRDPSAEVRAAAADALGRIGASTAEPDLRAALDDRVHFVRAEAAAALGVIGSSEALPKLLEIARSDRFRPARSAARALARIDREALRRAAAEPEAGPHLHEAADLLTV